MQASTAPNKLKRASGNADGTFEGGLDPRRMRRPRLATETFYTGNLMTSPQTNRKSFRGELDQG